MESWKNFLIFNKGMSLQLMIRYSDGDGGDFICSWRWQVDGTCGGTSSWTDLPLPLGMMRKGHTLLFFCGRDTAPFGVHCSIISVRSRSLCPCSWGYSLLLVSVVGYILLPLSSFWLLIPQALIMIGGTSMGVKGY